MSSRLPSNDVADEGVALVTAAGTQDGAVVEGLLRAGAPVDHRDTRGATALTVAVQANNPAIAQRLIDARSDVNAHDGTQLTPYRCAAVKCSADPRFLRPSFWATAVACTSNGLYYAHKAQSVALLS